MSTLNAIPDTTTTCEMCGGETSRLFDQRTCAVCRLYSLSASEESRCAALRMIDSVIHNAVLYEGVHPDDVRGIVKECLLGITDYPADQSASMTSAPSFA